VSILFHYVRPGRWISVLRSAPHNGRILHNEHSRRIPHSGHNRHIPRNGRSLHIRHNRSN
ncbi:hypothetical protein, partial [Halobacillus trueperi]|uniref:hypothetical protein n=1 Tax=Halobacillus trueperi TaxID=156205 RepID=UPI001C6DE391